MSREIKELDIAKIAMKFKVGSADLLIFVHALNTYGRSGSLSDQVSALSADEFEMFYDSVMDNWGPQVKRGGEGKVG